MNFREYYKHFAFMEQQAFAYLPENVRRFFYYYVQCPAECEIRGQKNDKWLRDNRTLEIEQKEVKEKLQRAYDEKSEINRKLQQTYKEKSERGLEIKNLNKIIEDIKKTRTYRLARILGAPVRLFRKIAKKIKE